MRTRRAHDSAYLRYAWGLRLCEYELAASGFMLCQDTVPNPLATRVLKILYCNNPDNGILLSTMIVAVSDSVPKQFELATRRLGCETAARRFTTGHRLKDAIHESDVIFTDESQRIEEVAISLHTLIATTTHGLSQKSCTEMILLISLASIWRDRAAAAVSDQCTVPYSTRICRSELESTSSIFLLCYR
jgi:hypothetical protein